MKADVQITNTNELDKLSTGRKISPFCTRLFSLRMENTVYKRIDSAGNSGWSLRHRQSSDNAEEPTPRVEPALLLSPRAIRPDAWKLKGGRR
jgi:hypothetical protein